MHLQCSPDNHVFAETINVMNSELVPCVLFWPEHGALREALPLSFQQNFPNCACIIDCFEVFIERPSDLVARAQTYSNYKSHCAAKYLIRITPQGMMSFISKGWAGRTSDKYITEHSAFLDNLQHRDLILANRDFSVN